MSNSNAIDVMRIALQQYGYVESPAGSNRTKFGKWFGINGVPWCAEFVSWSGSQPKGDNPIYKSANAADIEDMTVRSKGGKYILKQTSNNAKKKKALPKYKFGDLISFNLNGGSSRVHTALVVGVYGDSIYCIEGNTSFSDAGSQSNGGCVALRKRNYTTGVCIVRPKYMEKKFYVPSESYKGKTPTLPTKGHLEYGDKGVNVARLQKCLAWANGYDLKADKKYGAKTLAEVAIFQAANGLAPDGQFGKKTLAKLEALIKSKKDKPADKPKNPESTNTSTDDKKPVESTPVIKPTGKCIDVSAWQGVISVSVWKKMQKSGIANVILRSSYTSQAKFVLNKDKYFEVNVWNAHEAGMNIGIYHYSQAITEAEAKKEAKFCLDTIKPYKKYINLPVAFDWEFGDRLDAVVARKNGKDKNGKICSAFCNVVKDNGYDAMVYANLFTLNNYLPDDLYKTWKIWVAQYNKTCNYKHPWYLWQYTSSTKVDGINGYVDMSRFKELDPKPEPKPEAKKTKATKVSEKAVSLAWPYGTSKDVYTGEPRPSYKKALNEAYPDRSKWSVLPRTGRSCDVFAGTVLRTSGVDKNFPRGLSEQVPYLKKHTDLYKPTGISKSKDMKDGDIIIYTKAKGGHICFCCVIDGVKYRVDAGAGGKRYGMVAKPMGNYTPSKYTSFEVYRIHD